MSDPEICPICKETNDCQLCTTSCYKGPCWCASVTIPEELLARIPDDSRNRSCICKNCVEKFWRENRRNQSLPAKAGDFYFENGMIVFTAAYLRRRGYCCGSGCRHCPYETSAAPIRGEPR